MKGSVKIIFFKFVFFLFVFFFCEIYLFTPFCTISWSNLLLAHWSSLFITEVLTWLQYGILYCRGSENNIWLKCLTQAKPAPSAITLSMQHCRLAGNEHGEPNLEQSSLSQENQHSWRQNFGNPRLFMMSEVLKGLSHFIGGDFIHFLAALPWLGPGVLWRFRGWSVDAAGAGCCVRQSEHWSQSCLHRCWNSELSLSRRCFDILLSCCVAITLICCCF